MRYSPQKPAAHGMRAFECAKFGSLFIDQTASITKFLNEA